MKRFCRPCSRQGECLVEGDCLRGYSIESRPEAFFGPPLLLVPLTGDTPLPPLVRAVEKLTDAELEFFDRPDLLDENALADVRREQARRRQE